MQPKDPNAMDYSQLTKQVNDLKHAYCLELFARKRQSFQIKKEKTISKNLEHIFGAALKIANLKGFHAMSMRDLSRESGLSIGALYNYFSGKGELLQMMQQQRRAITHRMLTSHVNAAKTPTEKLRVAVRVHLYLSEIMQPWFYFSFMEAKSFDPDERRAAVQGELDTEELFADILTAGAQQGDFDLTDCMLTAGLIKAMLQDWYLKRSKYSRRNIGADQYYRFLIEFLEKNLIAEKTDDSLRSTQTH